MMLGCIVDPLRSSSMISLGCSTRSIRSIIPLGRLCAISDVSQRLAGGKDAIFSSSSSRCLAMPLFRVDKLKVGSLGFSLQKSLFRACCASSLAVAFICLLQVWGRERTSEAGYFQSSSLSLSLPRVHLSTCHPKRPTFERAASLSIWMRNPSLSK